MHLTWGKLELIFFLKQMFKHVGKYFLGDVTDVFLKKNEFISAGENDYANYRMEYDGAASVENHSRHYRKNVKKFDI